MQARVKSSRRRFTTLTNANEKLKGDEREGGDKPSH